MIGGIVVLSCLSVWLCVCLFVVNFNLPYNFWPVRDRKVIFSMHTQLMRHFLWHQAHWPCNLGLWPLLLVEPCCCQGHSVSQTHLDLVRFFCGKGPFHLFFHSMKWWNEWFGKGGIIWKQVKKTYIYWAFWISFCVSLTYSNRCYIYLAVSVLSTCICM